jgi:hypothetical protein
MRKIEEVQSKNIICEARERERWRSRKVQRRGGREET